MASTRTRTSTKTVARTKRIITSASEAYTIFRSFVKSNSVTPFTFGKSRARWYSVNQMVDWYNTQNPTENLDRGWFGRSLNAAMVTNSTMLHRESVMVGKNRVNVYHYGR